MKIKNKKSKMKIGNIGDLKLKLKFIIDKSICRECLLCRANLDMQLGNWRIPLCSEHRELYIHYIGDGIIKKRKNGKKKN